jgi:hypothetical protein
MVHETEQVFKRSEMTDWRCDIQRVAHDVRRVVRSGYARNTEGKTLTIT